MSKEQVKLLAEQVYREVLNVQNGFDILAKNLDPPFAWETKKIIDDSIRALVFASSLTLRNLEKE